MREEAIGLEPKFKLPDHHYLNGMDGRQMVQWVETHAKLDAEAWMVKHHKKLDFGKKLMRPEKQELGYLLYALMREVFAVNPKAPLAVEGIEYALHSNNICVGSYQSCQYRRRSR